ncbi:CapA family protein [Paenibacillus sp. GCM10027626]|uniref:CapA family protein n=1 Tax=Paenibacillus sp. GCM10027626 TaxID=3273411 RepID=UPI0036340AB7
MRITRSEVLKQQRKIRARNRRRIILLNCVFLLAIAALVAVWTSGGSDNNGKPSGLADGQAGERLNPTADNGGADNAGQSPAGNNDGNDEGQQEGKQRDESAASNQEEEAGQPDADKEDPAGNKENEGTAEPEEAVIEDKPPLISGTDGTVTLAFVGDILLAGAVDKLMQKHGYDYPYAKALPYLQKPDLTAANLENPVTVRGTPAQDKQFVFKGSPKSLPALTESGIDVVTLANNHTLDMGVVGLLDTIGHLDEVGMPHTGGGNDEEEAYEPVILEAKGIKVAYVGVSRVLPDVAWKAGPNRPGVAESYETERGIAAVKKAKEQADIVVVMIHWGREKVDYPVDYQPAMGREYIDAGADLIIGSHPHVLQGFEQYKGKWIAYSLGNFIFNMTPTLKTRDTGVLDAVCTKDGDCSLQFHPMLAVESQPTPLEGDAAKQLLARISKFSINAVVDEEGYVKVKRK